MLPAGISAAPNCLCCRSPVGGWKGREGLRHVAYCLEILATLALANACHFFVRVI